MIRMDGRAAAAEIKSEVAKRVAALSTTPGLGTVLVGEDPGSQVYVNGKHRDSREVGIASLRRELPADVSTDHVIQVVNELNEDPACTGFIVQLPLPPQVDQTRVLRAVTPEKDVDGLHPLNLGLLAGNLDRPFDAPIACTPRGIVELGRRNGVCWDGANVCIVGLGTTVGRPLSLLLPHRSIHATVDACHIGTRNLAEHTRHADIVVVAAGVAHLLTPDMVRTGAAVFDVGVTRVADPDTGRSKIVGDVDPGVADVAGWLAPNPGGVGPMTRAMLLVNVVEAAERQARGIQEK